MGCASTRHSVLRALYGEIVVKCDNWFPTEEAPSARMPRTRRHAHSSSLMCIASIRKIGRRQTVAVTIISADIEPESKCIVHFCLQTTSRKA